MKDQKMALEVITLRGEVVLGKTIKQRAGSVQLDLTDEKPVVYLIQIETEDQMVIKKVTLL